MKLTIAFDDVSLPLPPMKRPDGAFSHAEMQVGSSRVMIGEARDASEHLPTMLYMYVEDCDAVFKRAAAAGGETIMPPTDMFYGDRHGGIKDAWGNQWWIATHIEDVEPAEMERRMAEEMKKRAASSLWEATRQGELPVVCDAARLVGWRPGIGASVQSRAVCCPPRS